MVPAVFVSCVSAEFGRYRTRLRDDLGSATFKIIIQEEFPQHPKDTLLKLDDLIGGSSESVVHLVGRGCGGPAHDAAVAEFVNASHIRNQPGFKTYIEPFADVSKIRLSYTHWEVQIARFRNKTVWPYKASVPIVDGHEKDKDPFEPRADDAARLAEHLERLKEIPRKHPTPFASYEELKNLIGQDRVLEFARQQCESRTHPGTVRQSIRVDVKGAIAPANLLMKWGLRRQGGVVFFTAPDEAADAHPSLVALEQALSVRAGTALVERTWGTILFAGMVEGAVPEHLDAWTQNRTFETRLLDKVMAGTTALGFLVPRFEDASPPALQRVQAWRQSLLRTNPGWDPLIFLLGRKEPPAGVLSGAGIEAGGFIPPAAASDTVIVPGGTNGVEWRPPTPQGVRRLCRLTDGRRTPAESAVFAPVLQWLESQGTTPEPPKEEGPFPAADAVTELEALAPAIAPVLTAALGRWLAQFHPHLAPAFVRAAAGSEATPVSLAVLEGVNAYPHLVDAWLAGQHPEQRDRRLAEGGPALRAAASQISAAWARSLLRGEASDPAAFARWAGTHLAAPVRQISVAVTKRDPAALRTELAAAASLDVFIWLAQVAPELDLAVDDMPSLVRGRGAFWRVVEALPATPVHLDRLLKLSREDRCVLGLCSAADQRDLANLPAAIQRIRRLQNEL